MSRCSVMLGGVCASVFAWALLEQPCAAQSSAGPDINKSQTPAISEVVVTARRKSENLQDVPQSIVPVTATQLQQLQIKNANDLSTIVPGLNLNFQNNAQFTLSIRGVSFDTFTNGQPNIAFYINDAPVYAGLLLQPTFDVGQIEILRGPQGTTRGVASPSGALTLTTRRPNLEDFGGFVDGEASTHDGRNVEGAVNMPILPGVLAVRLSGDYDENDAGGTRSINSDIAPQSRTYQGRIAVRFTPSDTFEANLVYQHLYQKVLNYEAVEGPGNGTAQDPPISVGDRLALSGSPNLNTEKIDIGTLQATYRFLGQQLTYVGSLQQQIAPEQDNVDPEDFVPGLTFDTHLVNGKTTTTTQELRLGSESPKFGFLDYTVGVFYTLSKGTGFDTLPTELLPGALGSPALPPNPSAYDPRYLLNILVDLPIRRQETSFFGSVTFHLPWSTELTGGFRHIDYNYQSTTTVTEGSALAATPSFYFPGGCAPYGFSMTYPGFCDLPIPGGGAVVDNSVIHSSESPTLYNIQLSHHFGPSLLVYASTGTSYRPPTATIGVNGALATDPNLSNLISHPSEHSTDYEIGFNSLLFGNRAMLNATAFHQTFQNYTILIPGIQYLDTALVPPMNAFFQQEASVAAKTDGVDIQSAVQILPGWRFSADFEYAKLRLQGGIPCNINNAQGQPVYNTDGLISLCNGGKGRAPLYNAVLESDYTHPITNNVDGFVRALATIYPSNPNIEPSYTAPSYALLNLFLGLRSHDGAWTVTLFAKNLLHNTTLTDVSQEPVAASISGLFPTLSQPIGYNGVLGITPERQFGIDLRYSWGGR